MGTPIDLEKLNASNYITNFLKNKKLKCGHTMAVPWRGGAAELKVQVLALPPISSACCCLSVLISRMRRIIPNPQAHCED